MALSPDVKRVGDLLIQEGIILAEDITRAIEESGQPIGALAKALTSCGHASRDALIPILAQDFKVPHVDLTEIELSPMLAELVPLDLAQKHELVPLAKLGDILCVAKANYFNRAAVVDLRRATGLRIKVIQCDEGQINAAMGKIYGAEAVPAAETASSPTIPGAPSFMNASPAGAEEDALAATVVSEATAEPKTIVDTPSPVQDAPLELSEVEAPASGGDEVVEVLPAEEEPAAAPVTEEPIELEEASEPVAEAEPVLEPEPAAEELLPVAEEAASLDELQPIEEAVPTGPPQAPPPYFQWPQWQSPPRMEGSRFKAVSVQREEVAAVQLALKLDIPAEWEKLYVTEQSLHAIRMAK